MPKCSLYPITLKAICCADTHSLITVQNTCCAKDQTIDGLRNETGLGWLWSVSLQISFLSKTDWVTYCLWLMGGTLPAEFIHLHFVGDVYIYLNIFFYLNLFNSTRDWKDCRGWWAGMSMKRPVRWGGWHGAQCWDSGRWIWKIIIWYQPFVKAWQMLPLL